MVTEELLWQNLESFLRRVLPVAEEAGVRLALHPDDPPISPVLGIARIMRSVEAFQRVIDLVPSECNGITLCQGNFSLMTDDLPGAIRHFGRQGKIFFVHFRDVRGGAGELRRDVPRRRPDRHVRLPACLRRGRVRRACCGPITFRRCYGETNEKPGYETLGRLFAVGYIRGLREAAYWHDVAAPR